MELNTLFFFRVRRERFVLREVSRVLLGASLEVDSAKAGNDGGDDSVCCFVPAGGDDKGDLGPLIVARARLVEDLWAAALEASVVRVQALTLEVGEGGNAPLTTRRRARGYRGRRRGRCPGGSGGG